MNNEWQKLSGEFSFKTELIIQWWTMNTLILYIIFSFVLSRYLDKLPYKHLRVKFNYFFQLKFTIIESTL